MFDLIVALVAAWLTAYVGLALVRLTVAAVTRFTRWVLDRVLLAMHNRRAVTA